MEKSVIKAGTIDKNPHLLYLLEKNNIPALRSFIEYLIYHQGYTYDQIYLVFNSAHKISKSDFDILMKEVDIS